MKRWTMSAGWLVLVSSELLAAELPPVSTATGPGSTPEIAVTAGASVSSPGARPETAVTAGATVSSPGLLRLASAAGSPESTPASAGAVPPAPAASPAPAPAATVEPFGYYFTRFEARKNYGSGEGLASDFVRFRAQFGLQTSKIGLSDRWALQARFAPQAGGFWYIGGDSLEDPALGIHEAFLKLYGPGVRIDAGRFEMSYGEELVIGTVGWNHIGRAFEGVRLHVQPRPDSFWIDAFVTQLKEGQAESVVSDELVAGDRYFTGVYAGLGPMISSTMDLDAYLLHLYSPGYIAIDETTRKANGEFTLGLRAKGKAGALDYRAEAGVQMGSRQGETDPVDVFAYQGDLEAGITIPVASGLRFGLEGFYASGDNADTTDTNEAWNQLFPTAHKWLGLMDVIEPRSNVAGGVLHLKLGFTERASLLIDGHTFFRPQVAEGAEKYAGSELDTNLVYALGKKLSVRGSYDIFLTSTEAQDAGAEPMFHFVELELLSRF